MGHPAVKPLALTNPSQNPRPCGIGGGFLGVSGYIGNHPWKTFRPHGVQVTNGRNRIKNKVPSTRASPANFSQSPNPGGKFNPVPSSPETLVTAQGTLL